MMRVREVEENDLTLLVEFLQKKWGSRVIDTTKETWLRRFEIWWTSNPAFTSQIPRGWILENETEIVGFIGNVPVKFLIHGQERIAAAAVLWCVDPSIRGIFSIRLFNEYLNQKNISLLLFDTRNDKLKKILCRYKFEEIGLPTTQTEYFTIINRKINRKNVVAMVRGFLAQGKVSSVNDIRELFKRSGILLCAYIFKGPGIRSKILPGEKKTISLCTSCDNSFSRIWEPYQNTCDVTLSRDTKTLNWLYFSFIKPPNRRIVIQSRRSGDNSLAGYLVVDIFRKKTSDAGIMQLMDMCIENNDPHTLQSLLTFTIKFGEQNNAALLGLWANNLETDSFFYSCFKLMRVAKADRYVRFSNIPNIQSKSLILYFPTIAPPTGIDHI
jgi:hypothetical protein